MSITDTYTKQINSYSRTAKTLQAELAAPYLPDDVRSSLIGACKYLDSRIKSLTDIMNELAPPAAAVVAEVQG